LMEELIKKDLNTWSQNTNGFHYKRTLSITIGGGCGDQLCSSPVLEFIRKCYPKETTDIYCFTHWKRLFKHLENDFIFSDIEGIIPQDTSIYFMETSPKVEQMIWRFISHPLVHPVDYISLSCLRRTIPDAEKSIHLEVYPEDLEEIKDIPIGDRTILVHPGRGWKSKTMSAEYWLNIINLLKNDGFNPIIIGKHIGEDQGYVEFPAPEGVVDLRDMISLGGLIALISKAPFLISNDSAPIHIAGAFDNWIFLLASCKNPDHIFPYRNGTKSYKTKAFYKELTCDKIESLPTSVKDVTVDKVVGNIEDYLLEPELIVKEIFKIKEIKNGI